MKTHCFFAHVALAADAHVIASPQATANMLIEVNPTAMVSGGRRRNLNVTTLTTSERTKLAGGIAKTAALDYLKSETEFGKFSVRRFIDFHLIETPTYISIRPPPNKTLPDDSKVWRLAQLESDKLRTTPLSGNDE